MDAIRKQASKLREQVARQQQVIHPFDAQAEGELILSTDDYVVVRQVAPNGWSEGDFNGNAGWFPSAHVEKQDTIPPSKIM